MPFEDNLKARMDAGEHPTLYGYSDTLQKELTTVKEVAEFIYTEGLKGDVLITTSDGMPFISTFGTFNSCWDTVRLPRHKSTHM